MTRFAFVTSPLDGHVNPTLGVAAELCRRGHAVTYHLPESSRRAVEATGATLAPIALPAPRAAPADPLVRFMLTPIRMTSLARAALPQVLDAVRAQPADVVVYDRLCVWGRLLAELAGGPAVMLSASYALNASFTYLPRGGGSPPPVLLDALDDFASDMHALSQTHGTPRLGLADLLEHSEPLTVVFVARELHPAAASFGARYVFAGPVLRDGDRALDPELAALGGDRPLAYVSLGTLFNDWPAFYDICFEAFCDGAWDVVLSGAGAREAARAPAGFVARARVPQPGVLARADVFVTHGGMNSVTEALWHAVPLVLVPQMPEQDVTAAIVAARGAGRRLERTTLTAAGLRATVEHVAASADHRAAAERLRTIVRSGDGAATAADAMLRHARTNATVCVAEGTSGR